MPQIMEKVQTNVKDRLNAAMRIPDVVKSTFNSAKTEFMDMKPAKAALVVAKKAGDGLIEFLEEQCDITRRWI